MSYSVTSRSSSVFSFPSSGSSESDEASASLISLSPTVESRSLESRSLDSGSTGRFSKAPSCWWHAEKLSEAFSGEGCVADRFSCGLNRDEVGPDDEILADEVRPTAKSTKKSQPKPSHVVVDKKRSEQPSQGISKESKSPPSNFLAKYHKMKEEASNKMNKLDALRIVNKPNEVKISEDFEQGNHRGWGSAKKNASSTPSATARTENRSASTTTTTPKYKDILKEWDAIDDDESINISIIEDDDDDDTYDGTLDDTIDDTLDDTYDGTYESTYADDETTYGEGDGHTHDSYNEVGSTLTYAFSDSTSVGTRVHYKHDSRNDRLRQTGRYGDASPDRPERQLPSVSPDRPVRSNGGGGGDRQQERYYAKHSRSFGSVTTATASMSSGSSYGTTFNKKNHRNGSSGGLAASYLNDPQRKKKTPTTSTRSYQIAAGISRGRSNISEESSKKIAAVRSNKLTPDQRTAMAKTRRERLQNAGRNSIHARSAVIANSKKKQFPYNIDHSGFQAASRAPKRAAAPTVGRRRTGE